MSVKRQTHISLLQLFAVILTWLISRGLALYAISNRIPFYWEVFEVKKLLEYGFLNRAGALVNIQYLPGHLSNPEVFNYVNHPYPIMWLFVLAYQICGNAGMILIVLAIGFLGCLAVLVVLRTFFSQRSALIATLLYTVAPSSILFDVNTNVVALGAIIWPAASFFYCLAAKGDEKPRFAWYLGLTVFSCGQISWFALSVVPPLMAMTAQLDTPLWQQALRFWKNRFWLAIIIGAALSALLFLLQILLYSSNLTASFSYALAHTGSEGGFVSSRVKMCAYIAAKSVLLIGPALIIGAALGLISLRKGATTSAVIRGAIAGFVCALFVALVLIRFYYRERTPYAYLLFPATVLTAYALDRMGSKLALGLGGFAIVGIVYVCLQVSSPDLSNVGRSIAAFLRQVTSEEDVVLSNLREQQPPFPSWDTGSREVTMLVADRLLYYGIEDAAKLKEQTDVFVSQRPRPRFLFLRDLSRPTSSDLSQVIQNNDHLLSHVSLTVPVERESFGLKLRSFYWRITGSPFATQGRSSEQPRIEFDLYEIQPP
jgi:hypothetical protein